MSEPCVNNNIQATAYHILNSTFSSTPPSILILDARQICSGATGRNGGHVKPDLYFNVSKYTSMFGASAAAEVAAFEAANVYAVKGLVEREDLDCDFQLTRSLDVYLDPQHARETEEAWRKLKREGVADLRDVAFVSGKDAERVSELTSPIVNEILMYSIRYPASKMRTVRSASPQHTCGQQRWSTNCSIGSLVRAAS
jgi:hypothetical protein